MADSVIFKPCEEPSMLDWNIIQRDQGGTVPLVHSATAKKRGDLGLHVGPVNISSGVKHSYAIHTPNIAGVANPIAIAEGRTIYLGAWINLAAGTVLKGEALLEVRNAAGAVVATLAGKNNAAGGVLIATATNDNSNGYSPTQTAQLNGTGWHWIVLQYSRATTANNDGIVRLFVDGVATGDAVAVFGGVPQKSNNARAATIGSLRAGLQNAQSGSNGAEVYMDDIGVWLDTYPTAPAPSPKPCSTSTAVGTWGPL